MGEFTLEELDQHIDEKLNSFKANITELFNKLSEKQENKILQAVQSRQAGSISQESKEKFLGLIKSLLQKDFAEAKALSEGLGSEGGYLVPTEVANELIRLVPKYGVARRNCRVWPMKSNKTTIPAGLSGLTDYWIGEGEKATASTFSLGQIELVARKHGVLVPITDELIEDSTIEIVDTLIELMAEAIGTGTDKALFQGNGGSIAGIFGNPDVTVVTTVGTTFSSTKISDLTSLMAAVDEAALDGAKWYMSSTVLYSVILNLEDDAKRKIFSPANQKVPAMLYGYPVELTNGLPKASGADKKFIVFGNLRYVLIGDRRQYSVDTATEATIEDENGQTVNLWQQGIKAIKGEERIDIKVAKPEAIAVLKTAAAGS